MLGLTCRARTTGHIVACYAARLKRTARLRAAVHPERDAWTGHLANTAPENDWREFAVVEGVRFA